MFIQISIHDLQKNIKSIFSINVFSCLHFVNFIVIFSSFKENINLKMYNLFNALFVYNLPLKTVMLMFQANFLLGIVLNNI